MKKSSFILYNSILNSFGFIHWLHITTATKPIHFTVTPISQLSTKARVNQFSTYRLPEFPERKKLIILWTHRVLQALHSLHNTCTTPAFPKQTSFEHWKRGTLPLAQMKNTSWTENEMVNLVIFTCSIHATEFNHRNNPVFTAQSPYCKSANRSTFFIS